MNKIPCKASRVLDLKVCTLFYIKLYKAVLSVKTLTSCYITRGNSVVRVGKSGRDV